MKIIAGIVAALTSLLVGCSKSNWVEGGLYSTQNETGTYSVLKVLKTDKNGVHLRLYSNEFPSPPTTVDETTLFMAGVNDVGKARLGMGHVPISIGSFKRWNASFIQQSTVTEDELEGYKMWLDASGGYFE